MSETILHNECSAVPVPRLHQSLSCMPRDAAAGNCTFEDCPPWAAPLVNLPLSPAQVRACRADLASLDPDELARAVQMAAAERLRATLSGNEAAALQAFMNRFSAMPAQAAEGADTRHAQYMLLLVWAQEERLLEIAELTRHCAASEEHLRTILGEALDEDVDEADVKAMGLHELKQDGTQNPASDSTSTAPDQDMLALLPPWTFVLEHLQHFLPENAVLLINDPELAEMIREKGHAEGPLYRVRLAQLSARFSASNKEYDCILPQPSDCGYTGLADKQS